MRSTANLRRLATSSWTPLPFLCPLLVRPVGLSARTHLPRSDEAANQRRRHVHIETAKGPDGNRDITAGITTNRLPLNCPGCGAYSQTEDTSKAGFYASSRRPVKAFIAQQKQSGAEEKESRVFDQVTTGLDAHAREQLGLGTSDKDISKAKHTVPLCDRCHELLHHNKGVSIYHPNMSSLQNIISETPHKYNHIYHVIDAADFPMSLIPRIHKYLDLTPQRSRNRRAKAHRFRGGRSAELSFIITRSDLLAPKKEQVDRMMPTLTKILRDALGEAEGGVRLGNVRCVSSKRGWWTKQVKEDISRRGGGQWMVGKVNVGKSNLFESVFPKGNGEEADLKAARVTASRSAGAPIETGHDRGDALSSLDADVPSEGRLKYLVEGLGEGNDQAPENSNIDKAADETVDVTGEEANELLLPPAAPEVAFPVMPTVSHLPGTTAQPIRLRFGRGRGELIDLPGLDRRDMTDYVRPEQQSELVMRSRVKAAQRNVKPGQSLLIGDLIRITPDTRYDAVFLMAAFVPLETHVTSTEKATAVHIQETSSPVIQQLAKPGLGEQMQSAGEFELRWNVTKQRAGPLTRNDAVGLKESVLPFAIYSADILLEGIGWVEIAVQVRKRQMQDVGRPPIVEVFSPHGKHIAARQPLGTFMLGGQQRKPASRRTQRPRPSMRGVKKTEKRDRRALEASSNQ